MQTDTAMLGTASVFGSASLPSRKKIHKVVSREERFSDTRRVIGMFLQTTEKSIYCCLYFSSLYWNGRELLTKRVE